MTVSSTTSTKNYPGDGAVVAFPTTFKFLANGDITVLLRDPETDPPPLLEVLQAETTDYTLTGAGVDAGGTVTMIVPPPIGAVLVIKRVTAPTQVADYVPNDPFPAEVHEEALDRATMLVQENQATLERTITVPSSDTSPELELPSAEDRANLYPVFDVNGNIITSRGTGADAGLRGDLAASGGSALISTITAGVDAIPRTLESKVREIVSVKDFKNTDGTQVAGDGVQDDTTGIQAAIDHGATLLNPGPDSPQPVAGLLGIDIFVPAGNFKCDGGLLISTHLITLRGENWATSKIYAASTTLSTILIHFKAPDSTQIRLNGLKDITLWTENNASTIRSTAVVLDFVEYFDMKNVYISNFGKNAIKLLTVFVPTFEHIYIFGTGAFQSASIADAVLVFGNSTVQTTLPCDKPYIHDIIFSSCHGSHIYANSAGNPHTNIEIQLLRMETSLSDAGSVNDKDLIYITNTFGFTLNDFLISVHPQVAHTGYYFKTVWQQNTRHIVLSNGQFFMEATSAGDPIAKSGIIMNETDLALDNVFFKDELDILGGLALIDSNSASHSRISMKNVTILQPHQIVTDMISRAALRTLSGDATVYTSPTGAAYQSYYFEHKFMKRYNGDPLIAGTANIIGDREEDSTPSSAGAIGSVCTRAGVNAGPWGATFAYSLGDIVLPTADNAHYYTCTTAGTSAGSEPTWPTTPASTVADGTVVWTESGTSALFKTYGVIS